MKFLREWVPETSGFEYSVAQSGLRTIRFWKGNVPCALVWQGDRNRLYGSRVDDLSGTPEPEEATIEVHTTSRGFRVYDIFGNDLNVEEKYRKATLKVGTSPVVIYGVRSLSVVE